MTTPADETTIAPRGATVLAGRYQLVGLLGSGGMGTVYRARDRELDEVVALKVLKKEVAQVSGMLERFRREVKLARKVTHKNVVRTFDIGEHAGDRFFTMEYVDGAALSALIASERPPLERVLEIGAEILEGLAASHEAGVVHGDLKPENVVCAANGRVVITDFGIARALQIDPNAERTTSGVVLGTPAYMAPEQVEGKSNLDGRADLYAFGCMLYRLVTGSVPWKGISYVSVAAARLTKEPPDPREAVPELTDDVRAIILRCMARDRESRYADARAAREDVLKAAARASEGAALVDTRVRLAQPPAARGPASPSSPAAAARPTKAVAVLPIENAGGEDDLYLAAALADDLTDSLSVSPQLRVRPRGAVEVITRSDPTRDARDIGRSLGVDVVIAGTLRRTGDQVRAVLRLVTVGDGFQLWAKRFERSASEILALADDASAEIADVLASDRGSLAQGPTDAVALELYLRGRFIFTRRYFAAAEAVALLRAAHERAPNDPRIAAALAAGLMRHQHIAGLSGAVTTEARRLAQEALATDPRLAVAHVALARVHIAHGELRSGAQCIKTALELAPADAEAQAWLASLLLECNRPNEALAHAEAGFRAGDRVAAASLARASALLGDWEHAWTILDEIDAEGQDPVAWTLRARLALWAAGRERVQIESFVTRAAKAGLSAGLTNRVTTMFEVALGRELTPRARDLVNGDLRITQPMRLRALLLQHSVEVLCGAQVWDEALTCYPLLEEARFLDLSWLDRCPVLEPLRASPEHAALRASVAARANEFLRAFDADER